MAFAASNARIITPRQAIQVAEKFRTHNMKGRHIQTGPLNLAYTAKTSGNPDFYVLNHAGGFMIVAADDAVGETVLGYSDCGEFEYDRLPDNARWWLSQYQEQIENIRSNGMQAGKNAKTANLGAASVVVAPLLGDVLWNQTEPYNNLCPLINGTHSMTGCVATAMAEIMYFHNWPLQGTGSKSYTYNGTTYSANFAGSEYAWNSILPRYTIASDEQKNAIARLMSDCGIAVNMHYGVNSSSAYESGVSAAMKTYFGYDDNIAYLSRSNLTSDSWDAILRSELDAYRPVIYCGQGSAERHAFVVDGYCTGGYFHFNFGWTGLGNGYFRTDIAGNYPNSQSIVYRIQPKDLANRRKVNGIYYNIIADNEVAVTYPDVKSEYSGEISIPQTIELDGTTYNVTKIGNTAFMGCTSLKSIALPQSISMIGGNAFSGCENLTMEVSWTTPIEVFGTTFDGKFCSDAQLIVPEGAIGNYINANGWMQFSNIRDKNGAEGEWTAWTDFLSGTGTYTHLKIFTQDVVSRMLQVRIRETKSNPSTCQIMVENWGLDTGNSLIINFDRTTNQCTIAQQEIGYYDSANGYMHMSDMPTYASKYTYEQWPSYYDADNGVFTFNVAYSFDNGRYYTGADTLKIDLPDGDVNADGRLNQDDLKTISDHILGRMPQPFNRSQADFDGDGTIDVTDISRLANYRHNIGKP